MLNVIYILKSKKDLDQIQKFISKDNIYYADKVIEVILGFINANLSLFPLIGKEISPTNSLREIIEPTFKYRIIYKFDGVSVYIISIFKYKDFK